MADFFMAKIYFLMLIKLNIKNVLFNPFFGNLHSNFKLNKNGNR